MAQSDARFGYRAKTSRVDHDLSQPLNFTTPPGLLCPIWFDFATPGDSYYMQHDMPLLRSIQLLAPMMTDVKVHFETFFVPLQMIYQPIENTLFSLNNIQSSNYDSSNLMNNNLPLLDYGNWMKSLVNSPTLKFDAFRLADFFGLSPLAVSIVADQEQTEHRYQTYAPNFFPWQILAYKAIFQYYYRLDDKTQFSQDFNWDKYYNTSLVNPAEDFMRMYDRPWDFDYFTSMYRSPILSNVNLQPVLPSASYNILSRYSYVSPQSINAGAATNDDVANFGNRASGNFDLNSAVIRQMFANEKLAMITGRTRKNYDSQVLAHYGVEVPHDVKHDLSMIHHDVYDLNVLEVTSLASTDDAPLGELAGKSIARGNGEKFKFTAPCHGVMMTIFSVEPKRTYTTGFDRINTVTNAFDLPVPEFDRLGNVPMYRYEGIAPIGSGQQTDIVGWKERYYQFKRKMPKASIAFYSHNGVNNYASYVINSAPHGIPNGYTADLAPGLSRPDLSSRFYISRDSMNAQCILDYVPDWQYHAGGEDWNVTPWLAYSRDPFIVDSHVKCKKVSWLSKDGEPIYD